ncbi:MAG: nucleotidyltransferase domain-containing protein [Candidatus Omnitrophota bacterium]
MMENKYLERLKELMVRAFEGENVKIVLFGSRARQDNRVVSDVDIGLIPSGKLNKKKVILLKEKVEELNIPYKVEIVDFSETSLDFKKEAMKEAITWKDWN